MAEVTPLCVLLQEMRRRWVRGDLEEAVALARWAAPYVHGRAVIVRSTGELAGVPDDELDAWTGGGGAAAAGENPE